MRDKNIYSLYRCLPRMSWDPKNLYNLWRRSLGEAKSEQTFTRSNRTLFQQRWASKALMRAYHGDHINERIFQRWYVPATLPDLRPKVRTTVPGDDTADLMRFMGKKAEAEAETQLRQEMREEGIAPVGSLMVAEVERRLDVFVFRACFAHSVYEARRMVVHGSVKVNGRKINDANTRLAPGDMVSVDPEAIRFLHEPPEHTQRGGDEPIPSPPENTKRREPRGSRPSVPNNLVHQSESSSSPPSSSSESSPSPSPSSESSPEAGAKLTPFHLPDYAAPSLFVPPYIEVSFMTCTAIYLRHPTARSGYSEIPTPYEADGEVVRFAWEWYTMRGPRMRSKRQMSFMPKEKNRTPEMVTGKRFF